MTVLILQPDPISPATRISHWLDEAERMYDVINLPALVDRNQHNDEDGPISTKQLDSISGIVICGGRMNCYSEDENPWIPPVMKLLKGAVDKGLPVLDICFGHQLLNRTMGGHIEVGSLAHKEDGVVTVEVTDEGKADDWFGGVQDLAPLTVYESHSDYVAELPPEGVLLAHSDRCPVEAVRIKSALGVQFHPEVSPEEFREWARVQDGEDAAEPAYKAAKSAGDKAKQIGAYVVKEFISRLG